MENCGLPRAAIVGRRDSKATQFQFIHDLRLQFQRRRRYELSACVVGLLGILLMLVENEAVMSETLTSRQTVVLILKFITSLSTVVLVVLILLQFVANRQITEMQNAMSSTSLKWGMQVPMLLLELLICSFHIPPGVEGSFQVAQFHGMVVQDAANTTKCPSNGSLELERRSNECYLVYDYPVEALGVFMVLRLYLFARYMRSASALYSQWVAFVGSLNDVNAMRPFFHFKALFKIRPLHLLVPLALINTFLSAAVVRILERPVQAIFANYWKSVWLIAVTLSATGFGDYYPVTYLGRAFTTISAMFGGILLVALIQSLFFGVLELSPKEEKVKHLIDLNRWEKKTNQLAVLIVQSAWRSKRSTQQSKAIVYKRRLYQLMRDARRLRASKPTMAQLLEDQLLDLEDVVLTQMDHMEKEKACILQRIQEKTRQLAQFKGNLEQNREKLKR